MLPLPPPIGPEPPAAVTARNGEHVWLTVRNADVPPASTPLTRPQARLVARDLLGCLPVRDVAAIVMDTLPTLFAALSPTERTQFAWLVDASRPAEPGSGQGLRAYLGPNGHTVLGAYSPHTPLDGSTAPMCPPAHVLDRDQEATLVADLALIVASRRVRDDAEFVGAGAFVR